MGSGPRWLLIAAIVLLGIVEWGWGIRSAMTQLTAQMNAESARRYARPPLPVAKARLFSHDEVHAFLAKAKSAEAITDPLQRCLSYPDPPDSHWSRAAVEAYCHYHLQTVISFDEAEALIRSGHAADLDRRLAQDLQAQLTRPESHGLLDRTYFNDFDVDSFDARLTLDAWKRASPNSAFAFAASGAAYVSMAHKARGGEYIQNTPQSNIDDMDRLLAQADTDLQRAVQLNPKITPAYVAMIQAGSMSLGDAYTENAFRRGMAAAPDDYAIYGMYIHAAEPKWGGSLQAMAKIASDAQVHVKENPLLALLLSAEPGYQYDACDCVSSEQRRWDAFPAVFDNVSSTSMLFSAGYAANSQRHPELAVVYLSEGLRFKFDETFGHIRRAYALSSVGDADWALVEANRQIEQQPQSAWGYSMRGYAYKTLRDPIHAAPDLEKAAAIEPNNSFPLSQLGSMYVFNTHEWDKGWDVANRLIHDHPDEASGWILRASIQKDQPRAGLDDTVHYFLDHFGNDPDQTDWVLKMRAMLAAEPAKPSATGKAARSP